MDNLYDEDDFDNYSDELSYIIFQQLWDKHEAEKEIEINAEYDEYLASLDHK